MGDISFRIRQTGADIEVPLHIQPRARRTEISGLHDGALKVKICAPPVDDAANRGIIQFFAGILCYPKSRLHIVSGAKSRDKILRVEGMSQKRFEEVITPLL